MRTGIDCKGKEWEEFELHGRMADATNVRFGRLVALFPVVCNAKGQWLCQCDCGNKIVAPYGYLNAGKIQSCGCQRMESRNRYLEDRRRVENIIGQKYGRLTIVDYIGIINGMATYRFQCDCGSVIDEPIIRIKNGNTRSCGCLHKEKASERWDKYRKEHDVIGKKFGRLTALEFVGIDNQMATYRFQCDCGKIVVRSLHSVASGNTNSCGCLLDDLRDSTKYDLIGQRFGKLTVMSYAGQNAYGGTRLECRCDCGNTIITLRNSLVQGSVKTCGCTRSIGENNIKNILDNDKIQYKQQYSFSDLISEAGGYPLYDFAILHQGSVIRLIEFDGDQHNRPYEYFGGVENFLKLKKNDNLKNQYALSHNIPLVRIPYSKRDTMSIEDLLGDKYLFKGEC